MRLRPTRWRVCRPAPMRLIVAAVTIACLSGMTAAASELRRTAIVKAVEKNRSAIVNIHGQKTVAIAADEPGDHGDGTRRVNGMGTGVVLDPRGYIITNFHVVDGVKNIQVTLANEKGYVAQLISSDPKTDLALIKINTPDRLPVIEIGTSSDLMIGEPVVAVGNAYGYEHTVTRGIISALHRSVQVSDVQDYQDLIQTDASINPGNSGGPLLNIDGQMIGINVAVRAGAQGIGFAIPVDRVLVIATNLMSVQRLEGTWHGVVPQPNRTTADGALIKNVEENSPAAKGGLLAGDLITGIDGNEIARPLDLERAFLGRKPGEQLELTVQRDEKPVTLSVTVAQSGRRGAVAETDPIWEVFGLRLTPVPAPQFRQLQTRYDGGLTVTAVRAGSPAAKQDVRRGDILVGMHMWATVSLDNVKYVLNRPDLDDITPLKFYILRGSETLYGHMALAPKRSLVK